MPPPIDRVDPAKAWLPWEPDAGQPWNLKWAAHLYRRAGFGASLAELRGAVQHGYHATLVRVFEGPAQPASLDFIKLGERIAGRNEPQELRAWWLYCILNGPVPLLEKLTLFWHNHFATSIAKVQRTDLMFNQNKLIRQHALGKFRPFLGDMSRDPAMLVWLDSNSNVKGKPNENYARELMELFSLGVGHYTEKDIREAARAFTGWHTDDDKFDFNAVLHDDGPKTVLSRLGNWNGDDVVRIVLDQPAAAHFLVRKLYRYLISESVPPPPVLLEPLADSFRKSDYDVGLLVKTMLSSRHFFSSHAYRHRIKCPVEYVVDVVRNLVPNSELQVALAPLAAHLEEMGQQLFAPPNVKGWEGGRNWLNTATVLARHNFAQMTLTGNLGFDPLQAFRAEKLSEPGRIVQFLAEQFLDGEIGAEQRKKLQAYLGDGKLQGTAREQRVKETMHAFMTMPEYQLA